MHQAINALIQRDARANRKDQHGDHEAPEIDLFAIAERKALVRRALGAAQAIQQQALVAGIHGRVDALGHHGRTAGKRRRGEFGHRNQQVADKRGINDGL